MKKFIKITAAVLAFLILFILTAPFLFKGKILEITKAEINKVLTAKVEFDFGLNLFSNFPNLTINLEDVEVIGKEAPFESDTLISMEKLSATVDIISVINGESIAIKNILIDNPNIHAIILEDGSANYNIMKDQSTDTLEVEEDTASMSLAMELDLIEFKNINIILDDRYTNTYAKIDNYSMTLSGGFSEKSTIIETLLSIDGITYKSGGIPYVNDAEFSMDLNIDAQFEEGKFTLKENIIRLNALEFSYDGWFAFKDSGDVELDFICKTSKTDFKTILSLVPGVFMEGFEDIKTTGDFKLTAGAKGTFNEAKKIYPSFGFELIIADAMFKYPDLPKAVDKINLELLVENPSNNLDSTVVDLKNFSVSFAENPFAMNMLMKYPLSDTYLEAGVHGKIDLNSMKDFVPLDSTTLKGIIEPNLEFATYKSQLEKEDYESIKALGNLGISDVTYIAPNFQDGVFISAVDLAFSPQYVDLQKFNVKIGQSDVSLSGKLENFIGFALAGDTISGSLNLYSSYLDLNQILGVDTEETEEEVTQADSIQTDSTSVAETPTEVEGEETGIKIPGNIDFILQTKIDRLLFEAFDVENVHGVVTVKDSKLDMEGLKMNTMGGSIEMTGFYATYLNKKPKAFFDLDINEINIIKALETFSSVEEVAPIAKHCAGNISTRINFNSDLEHDFTPVFQTFNGFGELGASSISIKDSKLQEFMVELLKDEKLNNINIDNLDMFFEVVDGRIIVKPFETTFAENKFLIEGSQGLDETMDFKIAIQMPRKNMSSATTDVVSKLKDKGKIQETISDVVEYVDLTFLVTGTMSEPDINLVWGNLTSNPFKSVKDKAKADFEAEKQRIENEARAKIEAAKQDAKIKSEKKLEKIEEKAKEEAEKQFEEAKESIRNEAQSTLKGLLGR